MKRLLGGVMLVLLASACENKKSAGTAPESKSDAAASAAVGKQARVDSASTDSSAVSGAADGSAVPPSSEAESDSKESPLEYACSASEIWETRELKALQTGTLQTVKKSVPLPELKWSGCEGIEHCEKLQLADSQKLLAVGQSGNQLSLMVSESCGDDMSVVIAGPKGPARVALRGVDMAFDSGSMGGDRFLLGGFARHRSAAAEDGFVPREYLVTGREGQFEKIEPARNKLLAKVGPVSSQLVSVLVGGSVCTTRFWTLGISECDFDGPSSDNYALLGAHLIYEAEGKAMKWSAQAKESEEILSALEWVVSDGVNVAWSSDERLYWAQPRWDLPELKAEPAPGAAGERPVAIGCGRLLTKSAKGWQLRNVQKGSVWELPAERFPADALEPAAGYDAVMSCDEVIFASGYRIQLKALGELRPVPAVADAVSAVGAASPADLAAPAGEEQKPLEPAPSNEAQAPAQAEGE